MLINLSNHQSSKWSILQIDTAQTNWGQVYDIQFPAIPPMATRADVMQEVWQYGQKVENLLSESADPNNAIHIMGETTFVVEFARYWDATRSKVPLVCSTTERVVQETAGVKTSVFNFMQFREL